MTKSGESPKFFVVSSPSAEHPDKPFAVIDGNSIERHIHVAGVRGNLETQNGGPPLPGFGSTFFMTTNDLEVQLEVDGDYQRLSRLIENEGWHVTGTHGGRRRHEPAVDHELTHT
jgi:hypothetical protein